MGIGSPGLLEQSSRQTVGVAFAALVLTLAALAFSGHGSPAQAADARPLSPSAEYSITPETALGQQHLASRAEPFTAHVGAPAAALWIDVSLSTALVLSGLILLASGRHGRRNAHA